ncbi:unnamed protein product [marine sediment metagenome]|uniref:Uncharacterized protein n=1 Tax=marine sediment metagenome TaxID=412755 RepID=X1NPS9_9ZZZZ
MNKEEIIQKVSKRINPEYIKYLVLYGNLAGNDINVMAVIIPEKEAKLFLL